MADRRRRRRDDDSEVSSESDVGELNTSANSADIPQKKDTDKPESEYESAEEEDENEVNQEQNDVNQKEEVIQEENDGTEGNEKDYDVENHVNLIDEEGGEEGIAEAEDVDKEFLGGDVLGLDPSDDDLDEEEEEADDDDDVEEGECVEEERQQGDGEECSPVAEKELDFDEDRRNPQYIPKKGTFYEHDDRNMAESPKEKEVDPARDKKKKKLWLDEGKWGHDRYREDEQIPKSKDELIEVYGYDIRCEDDAPRARRRRRYGRGPTKYDRNWKDETAYTKEQIFGIFQRTTRGARRTRGSRGSRFRGNPSFRGSFNRGYDRTDKFDQTENIILPLPTTISDNTKEDNRCIWGSDEEDIVVPQLKEEKIIEKPIILNNVDFPALVPKEPFILKKSQSPERDTIPLSSKAPIVAEQTHRNIIINNNNNINNSDISSNNNNSVRSQTFENSNFVSKPKSPTYERPPRQMRNPPFSGQYRGAYKRPPRIVRGQRGFSDGRYRGGRDYFTRPNLGPRLMDKQVRAISSEIERLTLSEKEGAFRNEEPPVIPEPKTPPIPSHTTNGIKHIHSSVQSSKNEDASNRPKRYSSLRQRPGLPETANYQQPQPPSVAPPHPYYETGYQTAIYATDNVVAPQSSHPQATASPPIINPPQYQAYNHTPFQDGYALRLPVNNLNNAPRLFPQVTLPAGQPIIASNPCITANPNIINFPPPSTAYPQFAYPQIQQQYTAPPLPPPPVSQQPDLYRTGTIFYCPQSQPSTVRHVPQKRPKAPLPIVPPPECESHRKSVEKNEQHRNSISFKSEDSTVIRTDPSAKHQPPVEVES